DRDRDRGRAGSADGCCEPAQRGSAARGGRTSRPVGGTADTPGRPPGDPRGRSVGDDRYASGPRGTHLLGGGAGAPPIDDRGICRSATTPFAVAAASTHETKGVFMDSCWLTRLWEPRDEKWVLSWEADRLWLAAPDGRAVFEGVPAHRVVDL